MIKVECPSCKASYDLDERRIPQKGMNMRCPKCGARFLVAKSGGVTPPPGGATPSIRPTMTSGPPPAEAAAPPPQPPPTKKVMKATMVGAPGMKPPPPLLYHHRHLRRGHPSHPRFSQSRVLSKRLPQRQHLQTATKPRNRMLHPPKPLVSPLPRPKSPQNSRRAFLPPWPSLKIFPLLRRKLLRR